MISEKWIEELNSLPLVNKVSLTIIFNFWSFEHLDVLIIHLSLISIYWKHIYMKSERYNIDFFSRVFFGSSSIIIFYISNRNEAKWCISSSRRAKCSPPRNPESLTRHWTSRRGERPRIWTCRTLQLDNRLSTSSNKMVKGKNYLNETQECHDQIDEMKNNLFDHEFLNKKFT